MTVPDDATRQTTAVYDRDADELAALYDGWPPAGRDTDLVTLTAADLPAGATVLDVGTGSGRDLARLRAAGMAAVGVDLSAGMLRNATRHGPVAQADMRALPWPDATVDGILSAASLLHLPADAGAETVAEFARVLRPGGTLVVSVVEGDGVRTSGDGRFFQHYRAAELDQLLARAGFDVYDRRSDTDVHVAGLAWLVRAATRS